MPDQLSEIKALIEKREIVWAQFVETNDARIKAIESGHATADFDEKLARMNKDIDKIGDMKAALEKLQAIVNRPGAVISDHDAAISEHREAWAGWFRTGQEQGLGNLELQADLNIGTGADGGFTVPEVIDLDIQQRVKEISPIRQIASQITVGTSDYKKLVNLHGTASGWVGETTARPKLAAPTLAEVTFPDGEIYASPASTQRMLDDSFLNVEAWLAEEVALEFAKQEGLAFITGNGTNKPFGFLSGTPVATSDSASPARAFGTLQYIPTGAAGAFANGPGDSPPGTGQDVFLTTVYALKAAFRMNAKWVLGRVSLEQIRKMKDVDGNYLFQRGLQAGQPDALVGFPIVEAEDMPVIAANSLSIAFGDFQRGYKIVDRMGVRTLRDPYTDKPNVIFYTTKRVSGNIIDDEAIKLIKFAAS